jgi:3-methyladenine DNA glycosylase Mpg
MRRRRSTARRNVDAIPRAVLWRGTGTLTRALGIDLSQNQYDLTSSRLRIEDQGERRRRVAWTRRIGINVGVEHEWRVYATDSPAVSR